jgi:hypothetical protein
MAAENKLIRIAGHSVQAFSGQGKRGKTCPLLIDIVDDIVIVRNCRTCYRCRFSYGRLIIQPDGTRFEKTVQWLFCEFMRRVWIED